MDNSESILPSGKPKRRFFRKLFRVILLLLALLVLYALFWPQTKVEIGYDTTRLTGPIDSEGYVDYVAALDEQMSAGVTPENNAAVILVRVFGHEGVSKAGWQRLVSTKPDDGERLVAWNVFWAAAVTTRPELAKGYKDRYDAKRGPLHSGSTTRPWTEQEFPQAGDWVRANKLPLELIRQATRRPRYYCPLDVPTERPRMINALLPTFSCLMEAGRCLATSAMLRTGQGDIDGAASDIMTVYRLARLFGRNNNVLIAQMVALVVDGLASRAATALATSGKATRAQAGRLIDQIAALPAVSNVADAIDQGERYLFLDSTQTFAGEGYKDPTTGKGLGWPRYAHIDWNVIMRDANRFYDKMAEAMRHSTYAKRDAAIKKVDAEIDNEFKKKSLVGKIAQGPTKALGNLLLGILLPSIGQAKVA